MWFFFFMQIRFVICMNTLDGILAFPKFQLAPLIGIDNKTKMRVAVLLFWPNETGQWILLLKALWKMIKPVSGCRVYIQKSNTRAFIFTFCNDLLRGDFAAGTWSLFEVSQGKEAPDGAGRALGSWADSLLSKETDITDATKLFCRVAKYRYSFIM